MRAAVLTAFALAMLAMIFVGWQVNRRPKNNAAQPGSDSDAAASRPAAAASNSGSDSTPSAPQTPQGQVLLEQLSEASQALADRVRRAVVRVDVEQVEVPGGADDPLAQLFGAGPPRASWGQGSGVVVDAQGYILTNYHVVRGARMVRVVFGPEKQYSARVVGEDALTDLALLKIDAEGLDTLEWGESDRLRVGEFVWAIGSPFGLEGSVSLGIVSAKNRNSLSESPFQEFLQTDAAINPGNSGGPLVDSRGHVVGITTAILGEQFQGISFAIPSRIARQVYDRLKEHGRVARGWLGIRLDVVTPQRRPPAVADRPPGAYVVAVGSEGSPARQAGIRAGDILTYWNGLPIEGPVELSRMIAQSPIGASLPVKLLRDGQPLELSVTVGQQP